MIFAGSDSEMISKLAKSIAHFFVVQNITEESKEVIYAYGMELLISDVLNTIIVLLIALFSHTLPAVVVFIAVFMGLRQFVGGFHANSHLSCMFTLVMVMMVFSYGICNVSGTYYANIQHQFHNDSITNHSMYCSRSASE